MKQKERYKKKYQHEKAPARRMPSIDDLEGNMIHFKFYPQDLPGEWDKEIHERKKAKQNGSVWYNPEYDYEAPGEKRGKTHGK